MSNTVYVCFCINFHNRYVFIVDPFSEQSHFYQNLLKKSGRDNKLMFLITFNMMVFFFVFFYNYSLINSILSFSRINQQLNKLCIIRIINVYHI